MFLAFLDVATNHRFAINFNHVQGFYPNKSGGSTITMLDGHSVDVTESYTSIMDKLARMSK